MQEKNGVKRKTDFKVKIGEIFKDDKRDIVIIDKEIRTRVDRNGNNPKNDKWYKYHCNKDNYEDWIIESDLLTKKRGCKLCSGYVHILGINMIYDTDPWMIPIIGEETAKKYSHGSDFEIYPICPDCGRTKSIKMAISTIYRYRSMNCNCSDGIKYPNKFAFKMLEELSVDFINEYSPDWIGDKSYDFYISSMNLIIEMDGGLGHGKGKHSKSKISIIKTKEIDDYKDEIAKLHGIKVIRVDCDYDKIENRFEFIKNNILNNKELNHVFDLSNINWNKCNEYALNNLIKEACKLWNNGVHSTKEIGIIMHYRSDTIIDWLKQGNGIWCDYDPKEEMRKSAERNRMKKIVEVYKDGIYKGEFPSGSELERKSLEIFGVQFSLSKISNVCNGKRKSHQGYTFKYKE
jgi:very-short-patch-repair endonuclease